MHSKKCFDPVVDGHTRLLVLGSLPGEQSLALGQYYANRQNQFWRLMSEVVEVDLAKLDYDARLAALLERRVGLWDVVAEASRQGSLDSRIRDRNDNDLITMLAELPQLTCIAFNGGMAARLGMKVLGAHAARYRIAALPSSSPAYTLPYAEKSRRWQELRGY